MCKTPRKEKKRTEDSKRMCQIKRMKFNKGKNEVLHWGGGQLNINIQSRTSGLAVVLMGKNLGVVI